MPNAALDEHLDKIYRLSRTGLYTTKKREQEVRKAQFEWHGRYCPFCKTGNK